MSALQDSFIEGWRTTIGAALPQVVPNGIWEAEHASLLPDQIPGSPASGFTLPYVVFVTPNYTPSDDWGADNDVWEVVFSVCVVDDCPLGDSSGLRAMAEALKDYIRKNDLSVGQVIDVAKGGLVGTHIDMETEPNITFFAQESSERGVWMTAACILGELASS